MIVFDAGDVTARLEAIRRIMAGRPDIWEQVGAYANSQILQRTSRGVDFKGKKFADYSQGYARIRQKKGHPIGRVNLFFSGRMLAALTQRAHGNSVRLFFSSPEEGRKAYYNNRTREFFNVSEKDKAAMAGIISEAINGA